MKLRVSVRFVNDGSPRFRLAATRPQAVTTKAATYIGTLARARCSPCVAVSDSALRTPDEGTYILYRLRLDCALRVWSEQHRAHLRRAQTFQVPVLLLLRRPTPIRCKRKRVGIQNEHLCPEQGHGR